MAVSSPVGEMIYVVPTQAGASDAARRDLKGSVVQILSRSGVRVLAGALGGYVSLVVPMAGVIAAAIGAALLINRDRMHRSATGGGFLFGAGSIVAWLLSPALTNHDPAVTYSPPTVPVLTIGLCVAFLGAGLVVTPVVRELHR